MNRKNNKKLILIPIILFSFLIGISVYIVLDNIKQNNVIKNAEETEKNTKKYNTIDKMFSSENYIIVLEQENYINEKNEKETITLASKKDDILIELKFINTHETIMYKDNVTYMISHDNKIYDKIEGKDENSLEIRTFLIEELIKEEKQEYKEGKEIIDGIEYEYEEYELQEMTKRYYFSNNNLAYIKITDNEEETILKVKKLSCEVDDKLFEIPSDYKNINLSEEIID